MKKISLILVLMLLATPVLASEKEHLQCMVDKVQIEQDLIKCQAQLLQVQYDRKSMELQNLSVQLNDINKLTEETINEETNEN